MLQQWPSEGVTIGRGRRRGADWRTSEDHWRRTWVGGDNRSRVMFIGIVIRIWWPGGSSSVLLTGVPWSGGFPFPKAPSFQGDKEKWGVKEMELNGWVGRVATSRFVL